MNSEDVISIDPEEAIRIINENSLLTTLLRVSDTGRGMRLNETSRGGGATVREAIDRFGAARAQGEEDTNG